MSPGRSQSRAETGPAPVLGWREYGGLFLLGLAVAAGVAYWQRTPGYMDADYYFALGRELARGRGFWQPFLWNFLDDPAGLPHPSHGYWPPLASLLSALSLRLAGGEGFAAGRLGALLTAALLPPLTAALSWALEPRRSLALLAGGLAACGGFYAVFLPTTDTFGIVMLLGGATALLLTRSDLTGWRALALGLLAGALHLARTEGFLLLLASLPLIGRGPRRAASTGALLLGYGLAFGPWMAHNLATFGAPLAPGGLRGAWILDYDELFSYPADLLTPARWWAAGLPTLLGQRLTALNLNLQTALAVQGMIFLGPLMLLGAWQRRRSPAVQGMGLVWAALLGLMTLVFPLQGGRGGFFHAGAVVQPLLWALAPLGLEAAIAWAGRRRGWDVRQAGRVLGAGTLGLALLLTGMIAGSRLGPGGRVWNEPAERAARLAVRLTTLGVPASERVMVTNPPGFYLASGREAVVIPAGDPTALLAAAGRYRVRWVLLDQDHAAGLAALYARPAAFPAFRLVDTLDDTLIFQLVP